VLLYATPIHQPAHLLIDFQFFIKLLFQKSYCANIRL
jgi:hypothetical protein